MSIDRADIEKLGELARIHISDENAQESAKSINEVLALVDQLQAVDTTNIEPLANPLGARQKRVFIWCRKSSNKNLNC